MIPETEAGRPAKGTDGGMIQKIYNHEKQR